MLRVNKYLLLFFFSLFAFQVQKAQDSLSFQDCLHLGIERNINIRIVKNNERIYLNNVIWGFSGFLPGVNIAGRQNNSIMNSEQVFFSRPDSPQVRNNARASSLSASANINWTVFDGLGMFYKYVSSIKLYNAGRLATRMEVENLISRLGMLYFDYLRQSRRLETFKYVMGLSRERMNVAQERYRIGRESKLEFQQAKVDYNGDSSAFMQQQEALFSAKIRLNEALDIRSDTLSIIQDTINIDFYLLYDDLFSNTQINNTSLLIAGNSIAISENQMRIINSRMFPVLEANGAYVFNQSESQAGFQLSRKESGINYGLTLSYPIFNGFELHRQRQNARIEIENSQLQYELVEQQIMSELSIIYNIYQNSLKLVSLEESNLITARENFNMATERFKLGTMSGLEMRDIQRVYLNAEDRLLAARYQAKMAEISLKQISGRISEYL